MTTSIAKAPPLSIARLGQRYGGKWCCVTALSTCGRMPSRL